LPLYLHQNPNISGIHGENGFTVDMSFEGQYGMDSAEDKKN